MQKKELHVSAIQNGTVIDHITSSGVLQVLRILNLETYEDRIYLGGNLDSKKYGKKAILKIENKFFREDEINKIALVAPNATLIEIRDYEVVKKTPVEIPNDVYHFIKCANPNCITNVEEVPTRFKVTDKNDLRLKCHYCEKNTTRATIEYK